MTQRQAASSSTWGISPQVRRAIRAFVLSSRSALEEDFTRQLATLGVTPKGVGGVPGERALTADEQRARDAASAVIEATVATGASADEAFSTFVRDCAFTTLNRLVGLRCLEERGMLVVDGSVETAIRVDLALGGSSLYFRVRNELPGNTPPRDVWRETLDRAYRAISERIGLLFDPDSEFGQLLPLAATLSALIDGLNDLDIPTETWGYDEVLGWVYQYYNAEEKDAVYDKLGAKGKIERPEELAAATCLYTERYMVDFLLQNTLGALWVQMRPDTQLTDGWPYFVKCPEGEPESEGGSLPMRVRDITLLDPACGSGHFLARAFDLFAELYAEEGLEPPDEVVQLILERNLHGIDIDLRAIQISALRLFLKACELAGPGFRPRRLNLVSTDIALSSAPPTDFLARFEGDRELQDVIRAIWSELRDAPILGSLLHPERKIDELLESRRRKGDTLELQDDSAWDAFRTELLEGLRAHFEAEAQSAEIAQRLFGEQAAKGVSLVEALGHHYDVVVTNPPFAGRRHQSERVRGFLERHYETGRSDVYAAFVIRCLDFCRAGARVGMVTPQSWMFLKGLTGLRSKILAEETIVHVAHLGSGAFSEIGGEVVSVALVTFLHASPSAGHRLFAIRATGQRAPREKRDLIAEVGAGALVRGHLQEQVAFLGIQECPLVYWLRPRLLTLLSTGAPVSTVARLEEGYKTCDNDRHLRLFWEVESVGHWPAYEKGGGYCKWHGLTSFVLDWRDGGEVLRGSKCAAIPRDPRENPNGLTYSEIGSGSIGVRAMRATSAYDFTAHGIFPSLDSHWSLLAALNSRLLTYLGRAISPAYRINQGYLARLPFAANTPPECALVATQLKVSEGISHVDELPGVLLETEVATGNDAGLPDASGLRESLHALLHTLEGFNERLVFDAYELDEADVQTVLDETGVPAGWHPLIAGYDALPEPPEGVELPEGLAGFLEALEHRELDPTQLEALKERLRTIYQAGPGAKVEEEPAPSGEDEEEQVLGAHIPIPTETFLEELSVKLKIHPISVFHLLQEMREREGLVCPSEMRRALEDYVVVTVLRLLGYRWPEQDAYEATHGPIIPADLVDPDGVIPLVACNDEPTLEQRLRARVEHQFGAEGAEATLGEFRRYVGKELGPWLAKEFFRTHTQRFKNRPIAWHLTSPEGTFQALVLYHRLSRETLQRISNLYAGGLINRLKAEEQLATERGDEAKAQDLRFQIEDVEEFRDRLRAIEEGRELANRIRCRWKDEDVEGRPGPYAPDIDDGVKVNIRPFQETGLLTRPVIKKW